MLKRSTRSWLAGLVCLVGIAVAIAGCALPLSPNYKYGGVKHASAEDALTAQRKRHDSVIATVRQRETAIADQATIFLPSLDYVYGETPRLTRRCVTDKMFTGITQCLSFSDVREMRRYSAAVNHEMLLFTARIIEHSKIFTSVRVNSYDRVSEIVVDVDRRDVIVFRVERYKLYVSHPNLPTLYFDGGSEWLNDWLNALETEVTEEGPGRERLGEDRPRGEIRLPAWRAR